MKTVVTTAMLITTMNLFVNIFLNITNGGFTIRISRGRITIHRTLPNGGYNNYNCPNYSNLTTTVTGNRTPMGKYPMNNRPIKGIVTTVVKRRIIRATHRITCIGYTNAYRGAGSGCRCANIRSYRVVTFVPNNNTGSYACKYLNFKDYIGTYPFKTVSIIGNITIISGRTYGTYNGYITGYPGRLVRLMPCRRAAFIRYDSRTGNGTIASTYRINYVKYGGYRGAYPGKTVAISGFYTRVSCDGYAGYKTYGRIYPERVVRW